MWIYIAHCRGTSLFLTTVVRPSVRLGDWNLQEWKMTDHLKTGVEFAGLENDGRSRRGGICRTGK